MQKFLDWWTPARRKRAYFALVPLLLILSGHGLIDADDLAHVIESLGILLGAGGMALARANVNEDPDE